MEMRVDNPCDRVLPVLGPQGDIVQHMQALAHQDVAAAVETVRKSGSAAPAIKLALEFLVLTAARSGEVRLATWDEMDVAGLNCRSSRKQSERTMVVTPSAEALR